MPMEPDTQVLLEAFKEGQRSTMEAIRELGRQQADSTRDLGRQMALSIDKIGEAMKEQFAIQQQLSAGKPKNGNGHYQVGSYPPLAQERQQNWKETLLAIAALAALLFAAIKPVDERATDSKAIAHKTQEITQEQIEALAADVTQRFATLRSELQLLRDQMMRIGPVLSEIETQFEGVSVRVNLEAQHQDQWIALLWRKAYPDVPYPPRTYYPVTSRPPGLP